MGAWLLTREAALLLGEMVDMLPLQQQREGEVKVATTAPHNVATALTSAPAPASPYSTTWLLSGPDVALIGSSLLELLLSVRHMGAIACIADALRIVAKRLLALRSSVGMPPSSADDDTTSNRDYGAELFSVENGNGDTTSPLPATVSGADPHPRASPSPYSSTTSSTFVGLPERPIVWLRERFSRMTARRGQGGGGGGAGATAAPLKCSAVVWKGLMCK